MGWFDRQVDRHPFRLLAVCALVIFVVLVLPVAVWRFGVFEVLVLFWNALMVFMTVFSLVAIVIEVYRFVWRDF